MMLIAAALLMAWAGSAHCAQPKPKDDPHNEFASFIDGFFAGIRRDWNIPGMVFVAVRDGAVIYERGYGHTDAEATVPVSTDATLFRVGAISKIFTAAAVMQLAERERVVLDDDVNVYLRRNRMPLAFGKPITVRHLLTDTAGFDWKSLEVGAASQTEERSFANRLSRKMPSRVMPPGEEYLESSMGYALLGSIVERYSRQSFASAIKRHIFTPLGMTSSTFAPSDAEMQLLATGFNADGTPVPYEYRIDMPARSMSTTAHDMGRFMIAALDGGRIGRSRVLQQTYADSMLRTHFTPHAAIDGVGLGWLERTVHGVRTVQMSGEMTGWSSFVMLIPSRKFGVFFAANTSGLNFSGELASAVVDRFFSPHGVREAHTPSEKLGIPSDAAGSYRTNKISLSTAEKVLRLFSDQIRIAPSADGRELLLTHTDGTSSPQRWLPVPDGKEDSATTDLFMLVDEFGKPTDDRMFFTRGDDGAINALLINDVDDMYEKLSGFDEHDLQQQLMIMFAAICGVSVLGTAIGVSFNKGKMQWEKGLRGATELWTLSTLFCGIQAAFMLGLWLSYQASGDEFVVFVPYYVKALFVIPLAGTLLLAWSCFRIATNMINPENHWLEKLALIAIAAGEAVYVAFLFHWRLLGFMF